MFGMGLGDFAASGSGGGSWAAWNGSLDGSNQSTGVAMSAVAGPTIVRLSDTKFVEIFGQGSNIYAIVGTISGTSVSYGSSANISGSTPGVMSAALLDTDKVIVLWSTAGSGMKAAVLSISGTTPSWGTPASLNTGTATAAEMMQNIAVLSTTTVLCVFRQVAGYSQGNIISISGTTITVNSYTQLNSISVSPTCAYYTSGKALLFYKGLNQYPTARIVNVSGTTIGTLGTEAVIESVITRNNCFSVTTLSDSSAVVLYGIDSVSLRACVLSLSGDTVTVNSILTVTASNMGSCYAELLNSTEIMASYLKAGGDTEYAKILTVSGTTLTAGSEVTTFAGAQGGGACPVAKISSDLVALSACISNTATTKILKRA